MINYNNNIINYKNNIIYYNNIINKMIFEFLNKNIIYLLFIYEYK